MEFTVQRLRKTFKMVLLLLEVLMVSGENCYEGEEWGAVEQPSKGGCLGFGRSHTRLR